MKCCNGNVVRCEKDLLPSLTIGDCKTCSLSSYNRNCNGTSLNSEFALAFSNPDDIRLYSPEDIATTAGETDEERAEMEVEHCILRD